MKPVGEPVQSTEGRWIVAKFGVCCRSLDRNATAGFAEFDYFRFT